MDFSKLTYAEARALGEKYDPWEKMQKHLKEEVESRMNLLKPLLDQGVFEYKKKLARGAKPSFSMSSTHFFIPGSEASIMAAVDVYMREKHQARVYSAEGTKFTFAEI